ncbi:hypothetical protein [Rhizobium leguminosarum]|uniref:hypothetical protein n=1 Tax=Rhizobium leguminosarum TaxID=384 RepID=UPI0039657A66
MPEAIAALFLGNHEALTGFTDAEAEQLVDLRKRLIENLGSDCKCAILGAALEARLGL